MATPEGWYTDLHTLNIRTGKATKKEVIESFRQAVKEAEEKVGRSYPHRFIVNMPCNASGQSLGFCYLYVTEPALYRMAVGQGPDGEAREDRLLVMKGEGEEVLDVNPCFVWDPDKPQLCHNVLKSSGIPAWITEEELKAVFAPFSESPDYPTVKIVSMTRPGNKGKGGRQEKVALVTFDPATREAQFALHMRKKFEVADDNGKRFIFFDLAHQADLRRLGEQKK